MTSLLAVRETASAQEFIIGFSHATNIKRFGSPFVRELFAIDHLIVRNILYFFLRTSRKWLFRYAARVRVKEIQIKKDVITIFILLTAIRALINSMSAATEKCPPDKSYWHERVLSSLTRQYIILEPLSVRLRLYTEFG